MIKKIIALAIILGISVTVIGLSFSGLNSEEVNSEETSLQTEEVIKADVIIPTKVSRPGCDVEDICYIPSEIVVQKGEEIVLKCSTSQTEALGCAFKSPAEHGYNMLRGAAYEDGRIQQKELNPNDCAMKITNIRQSDNGP